MLVVTLGREKQERGGGLRGAAGIWGIIVMKTQICIKIKSERSEEWKQLERGERGRNK